MRVWDGSPLPVGLRARLQREWEHAQFLYGKIVELERSDSGRSRTTAAPQSRRSANYCGCGRSGRAGRGVHVNEFFGWRQFRNRKEVGAAAGLIPTPHQSGDASREQGISKAGCRHIRAVAIEMVWCWLPYRPRSRLGRWYERFGRGGTRAGKVGIVALARKLLIELWRFVEHGVIPEGAALKA